MSIRLQPKETDCGGIHTHRETVCWKAQEKRSVLNDTQGGLLYLCVCVSVLPREDLIELPFCTHAGSLNMCGVRLSTRVLHFSIILSNDGTGPAAAHAPRMCVCVWGSFGVITPLRSQAKKAKCLVSDPSSAGRTMLKKKLVVKKRPQVLGRISKQLRYRSFIM